MAAFLSAGSRSQASLNFSLARKSWMFMSDPPVLVNLCLPVYTPSRDCGAGNLARSRLSGGPSFPYSARNVIEGSTLAARHAGTQQAAAETAVNNAITPRYVAG